MEYFDFPPRSKTARTGGRCSLPGCPCPGDGAEIPVGQGYLYIPRECCDFRWDCRTTEELDTKMERLEKESNYVVVPGPGVAGPILVCELGARKLQLDLAVAQGDARAWWVSGRVPFRPTPRVGEPEILFVKRHTTSQSQGGCFIATAACGSTLEPEVETLQAFRDLVLRRWALGRIFICIYEHMAPSVAQWITRSENARRVVRLLIIRPFAGIFSRTVLRPRSLKAEWPSNAPTATSIASAESAKMQVLSFNVNRDGSKLDVKTKKLL